MCLIDRDETGTNESMQIVGFGAVGEACVLRWGRVLALGPALRDAGWSPTLRLKSGLAEPMLCRNQSSIKLA